MVKKQLLAYSYANEYASLNIILYTVKTNGRLQIRFDTELIKQQLKIYENKRSQSTENC